MVFSQLIGEKVYTEKLLKPQQIYLSSEFTLFKQHYSSKQPFNFTTL